MNTQTQLEPTTAPTWLAAQLLADWWSDPYGSFAVGGSSLSADLGQRADPMGAVALAAGALLGVESQALKRLATAADAPGLIEEHERLMVGPGRTPCPPYESMWADEAPPQRGITMGTAAGAVLALYRRAGLAMRPHPGELPDHLVVECEALAWCLEQDRATAVARTLLNDHLLQWLPRFCEAVRTAAEHPYYQTLAALTLGWISALADLLEAQTADV